MDDGYEEEIRLLLAQLQIVELPPKPLQPYKRFEKDFQNECNARAVLYKQEFADQLWNSLDLLLKEEYRQLFEREFQTYERLQSIQNKINEPIKKTNPYLLFYAEQSKELAALSHQERQNAITIGWQNLEKEEKRKYELKMQSQQLVPKEDLIQQFQALLEEYNKNSQQMPKVEFMDKQEQIKEEIDMIIGIRRIKGKKEYLVRWKGKTGKDAAWVAKKQLRKAKEMVKFFEETYYKQNFDEECSSGFSSTPIQIIEPTETKKIIKKKTQISVLEDIVDEEEKQEIQPEKKQRKKVQIETVQKEESKQLKNQNTKNVKQQEQPTEKKTVKPTRSTRSKEIPQENNKISVIVKPRSRTPATKESKVKGKKEKPIVEEEKNIKKQKREPIQQKKQQLQNKEEIKKLKETKQQPYQTTLRETKKQETISPKELPIRRNSKQKQVEQQTDKNKKLIKKKEKNQLSEKIVVSQKHQKNKKLKSVPKQSEIKKQNRAKIKSKIERATKNKSSIQIKPKIQTKIKTKEKRNTRNSTPQQNKKTDNKQQIKKSIVSVNTRKQPKIKIIPEIKKKIQKQKLSSKTQTQTRTRSQKMRK